ncbi:MAG: TerD family protein [Ruminococcus sp.]|nr:TerD family protein [Ruminococcus sp.]
MGFVIKGELLDSYIADGAISKLNVPAGVKRIGKRAFYECPVEEVVIPKGIYYIGEGAFSNSKIKSITLPDSVITLCEGAFLGCDSLEFAEIPKSVEEVRRDTFWSCFRMKKCRLHEGIKKVEPSAFMSCRNDFELYSGDYRVTLPYISDWAMSDASKCVEFFGALGTDRADKLFAAIEREDHKLPLAIYLYVVHKSKAAADYLSVRLYAAAALMINDGDNSVMLRGLLKAGKPENCIELFEAAESVGAENCAALLKPFADEEKQAIEAEEERRRQEELQKQEELRKQREAAMASDEPNLPDAPPQPAMPTVIVPEADSTEELDFAPTIEVFRRVTIDSALIYRLRKGLTLHSKPKNGFECGFDPDNSTLVLTVTNPAYIDERLRALIYRAFFGTVAPDDVANARPTKRIIDMDTERDFKAPPENVLLMLLTDTDIIQASEIIDEWSVPVADQMSARQAVPVGATHEHCIYRNGVLEFYELFSWNVRVAVFEGGTLTALCDGADCEWDNKSLRMFIDGLPEVFRVDKISAARPDTLRLPYTCHTLLAASLEMPALKKLILCRKVMNIGSNVIRKGFEVVGVEGSTAERLTKEADGKFTEGFGVMRGAGRVHPSPDWTIVVPDESLWRAESDYMSPILEFVNCSGAAAGKTLGITFIGEKVENAAEKGLEKLLESKGVFYSLYRDPEKRREIGLAVELYVFRFGEISGITAATYYINGYVIAGDSVTTVLTSYVGSSEEATSAVGTVLDMMRTIEFDDGVKPEFSDVDMEELAVMLKERSEKAAAEDKSAAGAPSRVVVSNDWAVTVPRGYVWSIDPDVIKGQRCLLILNGGEGSDISSYYGATDSYSCMSSQGPICTGDLREYCNKMRIRKLGLNSFGDGSPERRFVLKHTSDVAVFVQLQEYKGTSAGENGGANAIFRAEIITQNGVYPMQVVFGTEEDLVEHENKLAELLMSVTDKDVVCNDTYMRCFFKLNAALRRAEPTDERTAAHYLETRSAEEGFDSWLRMGIQLRDSIEYALRAVEDISVPPFGYSETAWQYAGLFAVSDEVYDPCFDREQEIKHCYIREAEYLSAFRSFVWLIGELCDIDDKKPIELATDVILAAAQLVESRGCFCYDESHYPSICGLPDVNIVYLPDGVSNPAVERLVSSDKWTDSSLDSLRAELAEIKPCIDIIYNYLGKNRDRSKVLRGIHSCILYVWCSLTIAANHAFALTTDAPVSCDFGERNDISFASFEPQAFIESDIGSPVVTDEQTAEEEPDSEPDGEEPPIIKPKLKSLVCGERISVQPLAEEPFIIEPDFDAGDSGLELDGYAFMLTANNKVMNEKYFVFFGQNTSPDGSVTVEKDNSCRFTLNLDKADDEIENIVLVYAAYGDDPEMTLDKIKNIDIGFYSGGGRVMRFEPEPFTKVKSMAACEIYRHDGIWKLRAVGRGYKGTLRQLCAEFGVEVDDE